MRLWHFKLISYLDRQRLLGQHRECCALRGNGWGKKHATVDYVFKYNPARLVAYHWLVMDEMKRRGYNPDAKWEVPNWRGSTLEFDKMFVLDDDLVEEYYYYGQKGETIYPEHNDAYLKECIDNLRDKGVDTSCIEVAMACHLA